MTTHQIEIEGLPDGWKPVAFREPRPREYFLIDGHIEMAVIMNESYLIVEKIQPRRIVLEETEEFNKEYHDTGDYWRQEFMNGDLTLKDQTKIWREVKEGE